MSFLIVSSETVPVVVAPQLDCAMCVFHIQSQVMSTPNFSVVTDAVTYEDDHPIQLFWGE